MQAHEITSYTYIYPHSAATLLAIAQPIIRVSIEIFFNH